MPCNSGCIDLKKRNSRFGGIRAQNEKKTKDETMTLYYQAYSYIERQQLIVFKTEAGKKKKDGR